MFEPEKTVGIDDGVFVKGNVGWPIRFGPDSDDDDMRMMLNRSTGLLNEEPVGIEEPGLPINQIYAVARHLVLHDFNFLFDDVVGAKGEIFDRDGLFQAIGGSVDGALTEPRKIQDRFAERFAGGGAGISTDAADRFFALDDADFFAEFGGLDRSLLAGWPSPYDEEIILAHQASWLYRLTFGF